ncbi:MAG: cysteine hydrolase [Lachnospiraceae bacterium]|nr:cysteine hydrolase [Lachnospiraceae bacterium]
MNNYLIVIDMQNDFIDGSLGTPEAVSVVPQAVKAARGFAGPLIFTRDTHDEDYLETQEGVNLPVIHCVKGTKGWEIQDELMSIALERRAMIFDKNTFGSAHLAGCMTGINRVTPIDEIRLIGVCTDICVISNAMLLKAALPETVISVDASCCAGTTPEMHNKALDIMESCQIKVINR